jgi:hypothetical protein
LQLCDAPPDLSSPHYLPEIAFDPKRKWRLPLPQYCRSRSGNTLWPMLIEKAYAKRFGCYEGLNGGHVHTALVDLTGGFSQIFSMRDDVELVMSGALWDKLVDFHKRGALLAAGSPAMNEAGEEVHEDGLLSTSPDGIVHGHAYSIVRIEDQIDYYGHHKLLQLRDPWGVSRWSGKWSRYDKKSWTRRMQKRLGYQLYDPAISVSGWREIENALGSNTTEDAIKNFMPGEDDVSSDGSFWISLEDFVKNFKWLYVCQLFDPAQWIHSSVTDKWEGETAGGPPNQPGAGKNPQFSLTLRPRENSKKLGKQGASVSLFVSITNLKESQSSIGSDAFASHFHEQNADFDMDEEAYDYATKSSGRQYPFMALLLLKLDGKPLEHELLARNVVASTGRFKDTRDLSFETRLPADDSISYTIFPALYPKGEEGTFRINVYCETDFVIKKIN